jgi:hypothetical protein
VTGILQISAWMWVDHKQRAVMKMGPHSLLVK